MIEEDFEIEQIEELQRERAEKEEKEKEDTVIVPLEENKAVETPQGNFVEKDTFKSKMDEVKLQILKDASIDDKKFEKTIKENVKDAAVKHTQVEVEKATLAKQNVQYEQELLNTKQQENAIAATEDKWQNKEKQRQFHFNGVKPIMSFVGITEPMNLFFLYFLTVVLLPFFLFSKLWKGTVGALVAGASDSDRPKAVKGFIWTLVGILSVCILAALVYLFCKWQGIFEIMKGRI